MKNTNVSVTFEKGKKYRLKRDLFFGFVSDGIEEFPKSYIKEHTITVAGEDILGWKRGSIITLKDNKGYEFEADGESVEIFDWGYMDVDNAFNYNSTLKPEDFLEEA